MAGKDPRIERTSEELQELYDDLRKMLKDRCDAFYKGKHHEARSLATILHTLLYDYGKSQQSVLGQLGVKDNYRYLDSRVHDGLTIASTKGAWPRTCVPYRQYNDSNLFAFDEWWKEQPFNILYKNIAFTREELVGTIRNMEGGSHVDPKIEEKIAALKRTKSPWSSSIEENDDGTTRMSVMFNISARGSAKEPGDEGMYDFELASICAIGEELLFSLTPEPENRKRMHCESWREPYYLTTEESNACKEILSRDLEKLDSLLNEELSPTQKAIVEAVRQTLNKTLQIECLTSEDFAARSGVARQLDQWKIPWNPDDE